MSYRFHIAVDPDTQASGIAVWDSVKKGYDGIKTLPFFDLLEELGSAQDSKVHIEASWLHETTIYGKFDNAKRGAAVKIAGHVGANRQTGKLIEEYCKRMDIPYQLHKPTNRKLNAEAFKKMTGWPERTNQDERDCAMLIFGI